MLLRPAESTSELKNDCVNPARICVSICARKTSDLRRAINSARSVADVIELRLDCLADEELNRIAPALDTVIRKSRNPIILTLRCAAQGGKTSLTNLKRQAFWLKYLAPEKHSAAYADIELDSALLFHKWEREDNLKIDWSRVICSHHDFETVPADLETIYERMKETPAGVLKIAVRARDVTDCLPVFKILRRAKSEGRPIIPIAMGDAGIPTRILGPSQGAFLTFASLDRNNSTAPGQTTAAELRNLYRIQNINEQTEIFGLIGSPVAHSVSPQIHNTAFAALDINAVCLPLEVHDVENFIRRMARPDTRELDWNLRGFGIVTAAHKSRIIGELDWVESPVREIDSVNTAVITQGLLLGYDTDATTTLKRRAIPAECGESFECLATLVAQSAEQFRLWTGQEPPIEVIENAARQAFEKESGICG